MVPVVAEVIVPDSSPANVVAVAVPVIVTPPEAVAILALSS